MVAENHYGNWSVVVGSVGFFLAFTLGFLIPFKKRDWKSAGVLTAFFISLFTEMFGIPLTIYFLASALGIKVGLSGQEGHLLATFLARWGVWDLDAGVGIVMMISTILILIGLGLIFRGWWMIHRAKGLVTNGIYAHTRHPQYLGIVVTTGAFLIQWPTVATLLMWPILTVMYYRLAKKEERELESTYGEKYREYKRRVPMFFPIA